MARKPRNHQWSGFTKRQGELLDFVDHIGNNGWARNSQTNAIMVNVLQECVDAGMSIGDIISAMTSIGYGRHAIHQLERWESKRTTGKFGR